MAQLFSQIITVKDGQSPSLDLSKGHQFFVIKGTETLTGNWSITISTSPILGDVLMFSYSATVTLNSNHISILGTQVPDELATKKFTVMAIYDGSWRVVMLPSISETGIIDQSRLVSKTLVAGNFADPGKTFILMGNSSNVAEFIDFTTFLDVDGAGVVSLKSSIIGTSQLKPTLQIDVTQLYNGTGKLLGTDGFGEGIESDLTVTEADDLHTLKADIDLLSGMDSAGVVNADLLALVNLDSVLAFTSDGLEMKSGKRIKASGALSRTVRTVNADGPITLTDDLIIADVGATDLDFTCADVTAAGYVIEILVRVNATPSDITLTSLSGTDTFSYNGSDAVSATITTPAAGSIIRLVSYASGYWIVTEK